MALRSQSRYHRQVWISAASTLHRAVLRQCSCLHIAVCRGAYPYQRQAVAALLQTGADIEVVIRRNETVFDTAARWGDTELVQMALGHGVEIMYGSHNPRCGISAHGDALEKLSYHRSCKRAWVSLVRIWKERDRCYTPSTPGSPTASSKVPRIRRRH